MKSIKARRGTKKYRKGNPQKQAYMLQQCGVWGRNQIIQRGLPTGR